jgi:hypothetical protein
VNAVRVAASHSCTDICDAEEEEEEEEKKKRSGPRISASMMNSFPCFEGLGDVTSCRSQQRCSGGRGQS